MRRARALAAACAWLAACCCLTACAPQRVEYRYRPAYMADPSAPKEVILPDGTKVIFVDQEPGGTTIDRSLGRTAPPAGAVPEPQLGPDGKPLPTKVFEPRETDDDGNVILRNLMPEHVVANAMTCIRNEEYQLMWDQLLAPEARAAYERAGGYPAFEGWCKQNRRATLELLNRMRFNALGSDIAMTRVGPNRMRATVSPHLWNQFQLRVVEFEQTPDGMKLLSIRPAP